MDTNNSFQHQEYLTLKEWIDIKKLNWFMLSRNINAIH